MTNTAHGQPLVADYGLELTAIFDVLRDPLRREIVRRLAHGEQLCSSFSDLGSPSGLSFHFNRLRAAGFTSTRKEGTCRVISLRTGPLNERFPGLLTCVLRSISLEKSHDSAQMPFSLGELVREVIAEDIAKSQPQTVNSAVALGMAYSNHPYGFVAIADLQTVARSARSQLGKQHDPYPELQAQPTSWPFGECRAFVLRQALQPPT